MSQFQMFASIPRLARKPSMESFVTPTDEPFQPDSSQNTRLSGIRSWHARKPSMGPPVTQAPTDDDRPMEGMATSGGTLRRLHSMSQLQSRVPLPEISPLLVTRAAIVHVGHKTLAWRTWTRQALRLTKHTISLHRCSDGGVLDIIVLRKVRHVGRVTSKQPCCLRVETTEGRTYYFAFGNEQELYNWLTDIHLAILPCGKPTDLTHKVHVEPDKNNKSHLIGLPEEWLKELHVHSSGASRDSITREIVESALPEITFNHPERIVDFGQGLPGSRTTTSDSQLDSEDEAVILEAKIATRPVTQRLYNIHSSLKIITGDYSRQTPDISGASEGIDVRLSYDVPSESPSTPLLTPDAPTRSSFRESPYSYRDPDARDLSGQIRKLSEWPQAHGGFADIWRAQWEPEDGASFPVAVKVLRVLSQDDNIREKIHKRLREEVRVWRQLRHKNIVPVYGTCGGFGPIPSMVSQWYENGNINTYLRKLGATGTVDRRLKLLTEVARGLNYLHTFPCPGAEDGMAGIGIVHGDLKGTNILVNDHGEAALADFGLSSCIAAGESTTSTFNFGSVRWMAPELFPSYRSVIMSKSCASDTYSYGLVILEVITGERPYKHFSTDLAVFNQVIRGYKPKRPLKPTLNSGVWDLMERCWRTTPSDRPKMSMVLYRMEKFHFERRNLMTPHTNL
ncbi:kinase-like domain-containing protein [Gautieria morchelliformis]|nr:kinase-like domain-containing protein [Gautieria morchelliformis]